MGREIRAAIESIMAKYDYDGSVILYREKGVYNFYLDMHADKAQVEVMSTEKVERKGGSRPGSHP